VVFGVGTHVAGLQRAVLRYKYGGERWWAGVFARVLVGYLDRWSPWFDDFDLLVAMPAYQGPGARRAWDPVADIVAEMSKLTGSMWPVGRGIVDKRRETAPMSGASRGIRQRQAATELRDALAVPDPAAIRGARLLVVDDVLAEGSTLREVARVLRGAGAREVAGLVLARPEWRSVERERRCSVSGWPTT
jgi:predicted amidophosphoribosyltransferase